MYNTNKNGKKVDLEQEVLHGKLSHELNTVEEIPATCDVCGYIRQVDEGNITGNQLDKREDLAFLMVKGSPKTRASRSRLPRFQKVVS